MVISNKKQSTASVNVDYSDIVSIMHLFILILPVFSNLLSYQKGEIHEKAKQISACCYSPPPLPTSCCMVSRFILTTWQKSILGDKKLQIDCQLIDLIHSLKGTQMSGPALNSIRHRRKEGSKEAFWGAGCWAGSAVKPHLRHQN